MSSIQQLQPELQGPRVSCGRSDAAEISGAQRGPRLALIRMIQDIEGLEQGKGLAFYSLDPVLGKGDQLTQIEVDVPRSDWSVSPDGLRIALVDTGHIMPAQKPVAHYLRRRLDPAGVILDGDDVQHNAASVACWLGGWDRGKVFYVVMVERTNRGDDRSRRDHS